jgi:hypothetical protein
MCLRCHLERRFCSPLGSEADRLHPGDPESQDPSIYEDAEDIEMERKADLRRCAADLLVVERAKELLLGE